MSNLSEYQEEDYFKPVIVGNIWSNNYTEYESILIKLDHT